MMPHEDWAELVAGMRRMQASAEELVRENTKLKAERDDARIEAANQRALAAGILDENKALKDQRDTALAHYDTVKAELAEAIEALCALGVVDE